MTEAVAQLGKGLDLLSGVPDGAARWEQELDLQIALGNALLATRGQYALLRGGSCQDAEPGAAIVALIAPTSCWLPGEPHWVACPP
jgi:hypothetical protein